MPLLFLFIFFLHLKLSQPLTEECSHSGQISVYLPRNQKTVIAKILKVDGKNIAFVGDMILGEVQCESYDSNLLYVDLVGDFRPVSPSIDGINQNDRMMEMMYERTSSRWPRSKIYYEIGPGFSTPMINAIRNAAWIWTQNSPMRFIESSTNIDRVLVTADPEEWCLSYLGRLGGVQKMVLEATGACNIGRVIHEFGHAIGWDHEHLRPDRDAYITVREDNIMVGYESSYEMTHDYHYGAHDYDYGSVMHYPQLGFSHNGRDIIVPNQENFKLYKEKYPNELPGGEIGQRYFLSTIDKQMSYTYLAGCNDDPRQIDNDEAEPSWDAAPWGGCNPQCEGASYRERLVSCRLNGVCQSEDSCNANTKPPMRQSCELSPGNLNVTFDEENWWEAGGMMQNVAMYDQFDWYIWSSNPAELHSSGERFTGELKNGPGGDASDSGEGRYLWFSSWTPLDKGDQAWFESPVVATTNKEKCEVSFHHFIAGKSGKLQIELVSCDDCLDRQVVWSTTKRGTQWLQATVVLPETDSKVRLRFVAVRGEKKLGNIGLDNIIFTEGCIRSDLEGVVSNLTSQGLADTLEYPYQLDTYCTYIVPQEFTWTFLKIVAVAVSSAFCCLFSCAAIECIHRKRQLKKTLNSSTVSAEDVRRAERVLKQMNARAFSTILQKETSHRVGSVRHLGRAVEKSARESFRFATSFREQPEPELPNKTSVFHRSKSVYGNQIPVSSVPQSKKGSVRFNESMGNVMDFADDTGLMNRLPIIRKFVPNFIREEFEERRDYNFGNSVYKISSRDINADTLHTPVQNSSVPFSFKVPSKRKSLVITTQEGMMDWVEEDDEKEPANQKQVRFQV